MNPLNTNSPFNGPLTPHQFRQNSAPPASPVATTTTSRARYIPLVIAGIALLVLPVTLWQINTQQDLRQRASEQPQQVQARAIAQVGNEFITSADLDLEYTKQQNATNYLASPASLHEELLDAVILNKLVAQEAARRNITVSDEEIEDYIAKHSETSSTPINRDHARDLALQEKIAVLVSPSAVTTILYTTDKSSQMDSLLATIRESADEEGLEAAATPFASRSNELSLQADIVLTETNPLLPPDAIIQILAQPEGETGDILSYPEFSAIVEISSKNEGEYDTFAEWLTEQKERNVVINPAQ